MDLHGTVRFAESGDGGELARLMWEYHEEAHDRQSWDEFRSAFVAWFDEALAGRNWSVAVADGGDGRLAGCVYLQFVAGVPIPGQVRRGWGYVARSYVEPDLRRQGLGSHLLERLIEYARGEGCELLIVWPSRDSVSYYERAGFRPPSELHVGETDWPPLELML